MSLTLKEVRERYQEPRYRKMKKLNNFSKYIYTRLATPIIKLLLKTRVTGNQVTIFWVALGFVSCFLFFWGNRWLNVLAILLLQLHIVLDYVDGAIARARGKLSLRGVYIELIGHTLVFCHLFFGIAVGMLQHGVDPRIALILGFSSSTFYFLYKQTRRGMIYCSLVHRSRPQGVPDGPPSAGALGVTHPSFLRRLYRSTQIIWEPVFIVSVSLPLALFDVLYVIPFFYGVTYPIQFFIAYSYQAKISDRWVDGWLRAQKG